LPDADTEYRSQNSEVAEFASKNLEVSDWSSRAPDWAGLLVTVRTEFRPTALSVSLWLEQSFSSSSSFSFSICSGLPVGCRLHPTGERANYTFVILAVFCKKLLSGGPREHLHRRSQKSQRDRTDEWAEVLVNRGARCTTRSGDDEEEDNRGATRSARVTRAARFGRSLALPP
jgi:hypothetical protein